MQLRTEPVEPAAHPQGEQLSPFCPRFQYAIELIGRRWIGAILRMLVNGPARFNEIMAAVPNLSDRLLTERLRELEREGLVSRTVSTDRPIKVTYALTDCGRSLSEIICQIGTWSERWVE
ncbi:MAG TPA: helix-turn-helix domain-containing protein [Candidatus Elarobacter sp.]|nr:helix-turn-helix domain-containing protein [Candidatus Elarobacter sp.]